MIKLADIVNNEEINAYMKKAHEYLGHMGAIEHSYRHVEMVSANSYRILKSLGYPEREAELAAIAGYLHDLGNLVSRYEHGRIGGFILYEILKKMGMPAEEIAVIMGAVGSHEEKSGYVVSAVSAAVIIADKADVHRTRVRKFDKAAFTPRDRVNYAVEKSSLEIDSDNRIIRIRLSIDTTICPVMEYFEMFLTKMLMCRRAAAFLGCQLELIINEARLL
ncbi:HD domain-containing protein [Calderihabitans maritimus]|uniref:Metal dependent phosphohydrolase n=1 Tax=Calderihabitans maritimus TaxID=1246530 RepID=A0A1Z5HVV0_9FIRM|nr:HD domain-containing protein [Calderihabitans maritimus]GAW93662.1 metal dependent phosphohydrolase [Calderihabitans maritimus]